MEKTSSLTNSSTTDTTQIDRRDDLLEALTRLELIQISAKFSAADIPHLYFKGTALAYSLYNRPADRRRVDSDLLIRHQDFTRVVQILEPLGFLSPGECGEAAISYQRAYVKHGTFAQVVLDIHWNISNRPLFRDLLSFSEAWEASVELPRLSPGARAFGRVHAMMIAIIHPMMHHHGEQDPVWWKDQILLGSQLTDAEWSELLTFARRKQVCKVILAQIKFLRDQFALTIPEFLKAELEKKQPYENSWTFAKHNRSFFAQKVLDLIYCRSLFDVARITFATVCPSAKFMKQKYGVTDNPRATIYLPFLYIHRALSGIKKQIWRFVKLSVER